MQYGLVDIGLEIIQGIKDNLNRYNRNASGKASNSLRFEIVPKETNKTLLQIWGESYIYQLEYGRGATKNRQGGIFTVQTIADWIVAKGIQSDLPLPTLAYLIWRKINREGYKGTPGVITDTINPNSAAKWLRIVGGEVKQTIEKEVRDAIKRN